MNDGPGTGPRQVRDPGVFREVGEPWDGWNLSVWGSVHDEAGRGGSMWGHTQAKGCGSRRHFKARWICGSGKNNDMVILCEFRGMMDFCFYGLKILFGFPEGTLL